MYIIFVIIVLFILIFNLYKFLVYRHKKSAYKKAGKKWDGIVKELSERK